MSSDNDDSSDDNTTDNPSGPSPNAAMAHTSRGANAYLPACGPEATELLAVEPPRQLIRSPGLVSWAAGRCALGPTHPRLLHKGRLRSAPMLTSKDFYVL